MARQDKFCLAIHNSQFIIHNCYSVLLIVGYGAGTLQGDKAKRARPLCNAEFRMKNAE